MVIKSQFMALKRTLNLVQSLDRPQKIDLHRPQSSASDTTLNSSFSFQLKVGIDPVVWS